MWRVLTVAEKLRVGWLFKEEDLDLSIWEREREKQRDVYMKKSSGWETDEEERETERGGEGAWGVMRETSCKNSYTLISRMTEVGVIYIFLVPWWERTNQFCFFCSILPLTEQGSARSSTTRRPSRLDMGAPRSRGSVSPLYYKIKFEGQHVSILTCCAEI